VHVHPAVTGRGAIAGIKWLVGSAATSITVGNSQTNISLDGAPANELAANPMGQGGAVAPLTHVSVHTTPLRLT